MGKTSRFGWVWSTLTCSGIRMLERTNCDKTTFISNHQKYTAEWYCRSELHLLDTELPSRKIPQNHPYFAVAAREYLHRCNGGKVQLDNQLLASLADLEISPYWRNKKDCFNLEPTLLPHQVWTFTADPVESHSGTPSPTVAVRPPRACATICRFMEDLVSASKQDDG